MKRFIIFILLVTFNAIAQPVKADDNETPYELIERLTATVFEQVSEAKANQSDIDNAMQDIIENTLMPHIDVAFASYKILGTQLKKTTKEERKAFVKAMHEDLVKTYSSALSQYNNQQVKYETAKSVKNMKTVSIRAELISPDQPTVDMIFKLRKNNKTGEWKAYDLVVEGISLVDSKRAELSPTIRRSGIVAVTEMLME